MTEERRQGTERHDEGKGGNVAGDRLICGTKTDGRPPVEGTTIWAREGWCHTRVTGWEGPRHILSFWSTPNHVTGSRTERNSGEGTVSGCNWQWGGVDERGGRRDEKSRMPAQRRGALGGCRQQQRPVRRWKSAQRGAVKCQCRPG
ncbi:hypothetical protein NDU88_003227 [Pleurodeles waltl]|uniref:Uncharacterized protein n=1 Tax=Pleurodeles waltl TaxID=8319 RepID=A0AAV7UDP9_PLEWA|nr:hypothetical protein NDU88_003227 [Pleurodeles waltl]